MNLSNGLQKLIRGFQLMDDAHRSEADRPNMKLRIRDSGNHQDVRSTRDMHQIGKEFESVIIGQIQIKEDNIGLAAGSLECFVLVAGLADYGQSRLIAQERPYSRTEHLMVVDHQDPDGWRIRRLCRVHQERARKSAARSWAGI